MLKNLKLGTRLLLAFLLVGIIPFSVIGIVSLTKATTALKNQAFNQLEAVREIKKNQVQQYFKTIENQIATFSENRMTIDALFRLKDNLEELLFENNLDEDSLPKLKEALKAYYNSDIKPGYEKLNKGKVLPVDDIINKLSDEGVALQYYYIKDNEQPVGKKQMLDMANDLSEYTRTHRDYQASFRKYQEYFGFQDIFLVEAEKGNIVYSVKKKSDFGTSLINGPWAETALGKVFKKAKASGQRGAIILEDYARYTPSNEAPASFIASPVFDGEEMVGVAIFQMPLDRLNAIMNKRDGMGKTGETYIVGPDKLMRSDSFIDPANRSVVASFANPEKGKVTTPVVDKALKGQIGKQTLTSYGGNKVLCAFAPLKIMNLQWALMAEIADKEAFGSITALFVVITVVAIMGVVSIVAVALLVSRSITRPVKQVVDGLNELAQGEGDLTMRLKAKREDEIGMLALKFNEFMEHLQEMIKDVTTGIETLSSSSRELKDISLEMTSASEQTSDKSNMVAAAAEEMSANMNSVSVAMEQSSTNTEVVAKSAQEMTITINEISQNTGKAHEIAADAVTQIGAATKQVLELGTAAKEIDKITETITDISEQTNLLALNATIEAARAGEAGKGFQVVANEIKELARQTATATSDIQQQINDVQDSTSTTASAIEQISGVIAGVNEIVEVISAAVEEQSATTNEIVNNITQTSHGITEINENVSQSSTAASGISQDISDVNTSTSEMTTSSSQVKLSAEDLADLANQLNTLVGKFTV